MTSVVIAAHNEAAVLGRCLDRLLADADPGEFDVTVVANGCTDATAQVARSRPGVRVVDLPEPGKGAALNAGDAVAIGFPRVYLDADITLSTDALRALRNSLEGQRSSGVLAVAPRRQLDLDHAPTVVRAYYAINSQLPAYRNTLFGRGCVVLSTPGRARFDRFPDVVADDLFLDSLFDPEEKREIDRVATTVVTPRRTTDLVRRLVRVRRGNAQLRAAPGTRAAARAAARTSWLRDVVLHDLRLVPAAACYVTLTVIAATLARLPQRRSDPWGRDESSRQGEVRAGDGG